MNTPARQWTWWPAVALAGVFVLAALAPPAALRAFDLVGYAVCHRIPDRSFIIGGVQLPLCARDTGMFTAALLGLVSFAVAQPRRVNQFPRRPFVFALAAFFLAWAFDGVNSYLLLMRGEVFLYPPQNWLRLVTGALMGVSLSAFVAPLFNAAVWRPGIGADEPSITSWRDVGRLVAIALLVIAVVLWQPTFLYGPIAAFSTLGVLALLLVVNALIVLLILRRESSLERWSQMALPLVAGAAFMFTEILLIDIARAALTRALGLPF